MRLFLGLVVSAVSSAAVSSYSVLGSVADQVSVKIDENTGDFRVFDADGVNFLSGGDVSILSNGKTLSRDKGGLLLNATSRTNGTDSGGSFTAMVFSWNAVTQSQAADADAVPLMFQTGISVYPDTSKLVFTQSFPFGFATGAATGANAEYDGLVTSFPQLTMADPAGRGVVSFQGDMTGSGTQVGQWAPGDAPQPTGTCRVTVGSSKIHVSGAGYDAYRPVTDRNQPRKGRQYTQSHGNFCDCDGNDSCNHWAFKAEGSTVAACQAKCDSLNCSCFDFASDSTASVIGGGIKNSGPVVLFNANMTSTHVLSAHNNFMAASQVFGNNTLRYGVMGGVTEIPAGYMLETVLVPNDGGVNEAMEKWGDVLLARSNKKRYAYRDDQAMRQLGYSTDNGAYYYYQTEPNKTYEQTLLDVKAYADSENLPYQYVLLDSWWYYKGEGGGVATWNARPDVFPNGLPSFYEKTGWTGMLHNRYWSTDTPYAKQNGGQYNFVIDNSSVCVPDDQDFWNDLIANKTTNGQKMFMYEQDWLDVEFDRSLWLHENISAAQLWMHQMNAGCTNSNVTIQMCMSHVRHILQSTEMPAVTNARASGDYHPGSGQWDVGTTALLAHAVGIAPSKDNYWSTPVQNGTHYGPTTAEPRGYLQSVVSTFSNGPVAPSDMVGGSNASLIMRACDSAGTLLRPDRSATNIDAVFVNRAGFTNTDGSPAGAQGMIWFTTAVVAGARYGYLLAPQLDAPYSLSLEEAGYAATDELVVFADGDGTMLTFDASHPLKVPASTSDAPVVMTMSPKLPSGWRVLGEFDKWIRVSPQRFADITSNATKMTVHIRGGRAGEEVTFLVVSPQGTVIPTWCKIASDGAEAVATIYASDLSGNC